jgi:glycosyltransferase involved in cell wall biosynthesis
MRVAILTGDNRERFKDYGHPTPCFGAAPEALLEGCAAMRDVEFHVLACLQRPAPAPEKLADNVWFHGLHVPKLGWMRTLYQGCIRATRKKLREIRPDIVHGQGTERDCAISAALSGFPNVLTIHGNMVAMEEFYRPWPGTFYWLAARLENFALRRTAGVFCNSAYTEGRVAPRARRVWRVPNAVRRKFLDEPAPTGWEGRPIFLNAGVISGYKQQIEILAVAERLWRRGLRFEIYFAGTFDASTNYGAAFRRRMAEVEGAGYARYLGDLKIGELIGVFDRASALVHCPVEEAFGLVVAEALSRNLKFFGAATGGVQDIASGVEGAELFRLGDWAALENAMARWIEAGCPRPQGAAEVMRQRYHPEVIARRHLEIYREVIGARVRMA